jgi:hypothetical protein
MGSGRIGGVILKQGGFFYGYDIVNKYVEVFENNIKNGQYDF